MEGDFPSLIYFMEGYRDHKDWPGREGVALNGKRIVETTTYTRTLPRPLYLRSMVSSLSNTLNGHVPYYVRGSDECGEL